MASYLLTSNANLPLPTPYSLLLTPYSLLLTPYSIRGDNARGDMVKGERRQGEGREATILTKHIKINKFVYFCVMIQYLPVIKGIHPGFILDRELKLRKLKKNTFAQLLNEHPQTIVSILKGRRKMNTALSLKIEKLLDLEEGILMVLQAYYDIEQEKKKQLTITPDLSKLRSILFWDTTINAIDWEKQKKSVIKRVFERGNEYEREEISRFYGENRVKEVISNYANLPK